jgi:hypothetical protein
MSNLVDLPKTGPNDGPDPELAELPPPRRPYRHLTLLCLALTALGSAWLIYSLSGDLLYAAKRGPLTDAGSLDRLNPNTNLVNQWVRGEGTLATVGGIRYSRPLEKDSYRLAPLANNPKLWVQIRVPAGYENEHFVAPVSFAGRLVPFSSLGLRYETLGDAPATAGWQKGHLPHDAWLLIDGETPKSVRWLFGLTGLFAAFCAFACWALVSLLRPLPLPESSDTRRNGACC